MPPLSHAPRGRPTEPATTDRPHSDASEGLDPAAEPRPRPSPWQRRALWIAWLVVAAAFVIYNGTRRILIGRMVLPPEQAVALALIIVLGLSLAILWLWMGHRALARRRGAHLPALWLDRPLPRRILLGLLMIAVAAALYARFVEPRWVVVRAVPLGPVPLPPGSARPIRLVVLSDLHVEGDREPWRSLASQVNATEPDVIVFLGDTINRPSALPVLQRTLRDMQAPHGKLAVRGNWDVWYWSDLPLLEGTGFEWLDRRVVALPIRDQTLHLLGWSYRDGDDGRKAEPLLAALPRDDWRLFAHHTPDLVEQVPSADLMLAGHTHGGQVALPFFGAFVTLSRYGKRFERGLSEVGHTRLYVNPGIGVEPAVPIRFGVRPEITLVLLGKKDRR